MPSDRDPRVDPRLGDELEKRNVRWTTHRVVEKVMNGAVRYVELGDYHHTVNDELLRYWRKWAKSAEVIHAAE